MMEENKEMSGLRGELDKVSLAIEKVERSIENVEAKLENEEDADEIKYLRKKEEQLREEKKQLRDKEEQLREEKKQLRDKEERLREKENLLLKQQRSQGHSGWNRDTSATSYINELLNAIAKNVPVEGVDDADGVGVSVIELDNTLQQDEGRTSSTLVVPPGTHGAWTALLEAVKVGLSGQGFLVIGSPGIGKSRTINFFIREFILKRREHPDKMPTIVFEHRKDVRVWKFAPKDSTDHNSEYEAFMMFPEDFRASMDPALSDPDNLYVVDTAQAESSKMPALVKAVTVLVASPDSRHFSEWRKHLQRGGTFFVPCWKREEIKAAHPYMQTTENGISLGDVCTRMDIVGPIPRRLYGSGLDYLHYKTKIDKAMRDMQDDIAVVLFSGAEGIDAEHNREKPLSAVFAFDVVPGSNFQERCVMFVSDYARLRVGLSVVRRVWNSMIGNVNPGQNTEYGRIFELIVFRLMKSGWNVQMTPVEMDAENSNESLLLPLKAEEGPVRKVLGGKGLHERCYEEMRKMPSVDTVDSPSNTAPVFFAGNFPVIDAADANNRGFSVTIAQKKTIKKETINKLRTMLNLSEGTVMHVVFVVPEGHASQLSQKLIKDAGSLFYKAELPSPTSEGNKILWEEALKVVDDSTPETRMQTKLPPVSINSGNVRGFHTFTSRRSFSHQRSSAWSPPSRLLCRSHVVPRHRILRVFKKLCHR